ncbi:MAG: DUF348 domain-containing protein [Anaerolineae bacterium]|nr:DUF348 domain-containing protein [Anaerolineae bacterium]
MTLGSLVAGYRTTLTPVTLMINENPRRLYTHQDTVAALITDVGLELHPKDSIAPSPATPLRRGMTIRVEHARPVRVSVDGQSTTLQTRATSVNEILKEAQVTLGTYDDLSIQGNLRGRSPEGDVPQITIRRAVPFTLRDGNRTTTFHTTAPTVGEALHQAGLTLYLADRVHPALSTRVSPNMEIVLERSTPVTVQVDGRSIRTRTHSEHVGEVLANLGIVLTGQDYTNPPYDAPIERAATVEVVRVSERFLIEQEPIAFESVWRPDPNLEIDHQQLLQEGSPGVLERRIHVRYENGQEISRTLENEYVAMPPTTHIRGYGTKIVVRSLDTSSGTVEYWRKMRMLATSYSAATSGVSRSNPHYGRTATGIRMRDGIVAVDPRLINLGSEVYVPGYGVGLAADTGGAIKGKRIDLGYADDNLQLWYRWVDVYLLTPVPPASQIDYTLP